MCWVWVFYEQIRTKILFCCPGFLGLRAKWGGTQWCCHHEAEPSTLQFQDRKVDPKWSSSLIKSSLYHCSFQFRCCKNKSVAFRKCNQAWWLWWGLSYNYLSLVILTQSRIWSACMRLCRAWWFAVQAIVMNALPYLLILTILAAFPRYSSKQSLFSW